jgi:hypothetical protein
MAAKTWHKKWAVKKHIFITPPSFMKFCPAVPEICRGQVHASRKERRRRIIIIKIIIICLGDLINNKKKFSRCLPFSKWLPKHGINNGG